MNSLHDNFVTEVEACRKNLNDSKCFDTHLQLAMALSGLAESLSYEASDLEDEGRPIKRIFKQVERFSDEATVHFEAAQALQPKVADLLFSYAHHLVSRVENYGCFDADLKGVLKNELYRAREMYEELLRLTPDCTSTKNNLANLLTSHSSYWSESIEQITERAISLYLEAIVLEASNDPDESLDAHYNLASLYIDILHRSSRRDSKSIVPNAKQLALDIETYLLRFIEHSPSIKRARSHLAFHYEQILYGQTELEPTHVSWSQVAILLKDEVELDSSYSMNIINLAIALKNMASRMEFDERLGTTSSQLNTLAIHYLRQVERGLFGSDACRVLGSLLHDLADGAPGKDVTLKGDDPATYNTEAARVFRKGIGMSISSFMHCELANLLVDFAIGAPGHDPHLPKNPEALISEALRLYAEAVDRRGNSFTYALTQLAILETRLCEDAALSDILPNDSKQPRLDHAFDLLHKAHNESSDADTAANLAWISFAHDIPKKFIVDRCREAESKLKWEDSESVLTEILFYLYVLEGQTETYDKLVKRLEAGHVSKDWPLNHVVRWGIKNEPARSEQIEALAKAITDSRPNSGGK